MTVPSVPVGRPGHNKGKTFAPEPLTMDELGRLVAAASVRSATGLRARALLMVMSRSGLRVSEALALLPKDIDHQRGTVRVLRGKGGKARTVELGAGACAAVERWMAFRAGIGVPKAAPIFCTLAGNPLSQQQVSTTLKRLAARAGIEKRVHAHGLRHTYACHLDRSGVPLLAIQRMLGHSTLAATGAYLAGLGEEEHLDRVRKVEW